ncbi:hypothetical protein HYU11_06510 [Candidatus Woesearchaeota archaeon]|nr:hypothetical protein [Candidatus Woesearchaeota archaeon]
MLVKIVVFLVLIMGIFSLIAYIKGAMGIQHCEEFREVGGFGGTAGSEGEARMVALNYYNLMGFSFGSGDFGARRVDKQWLVQVNVSKLGECEAPRESSECVGRLKLYRDYLGSACSRRLNHSKCIGDLILQESFFGNKILKRIPC